MAEISIDFLRGVDVSSTMIEWFGLGRNGYSHCASVLSDGRYLDARSDVLAGVPAGVHIRKPETEKCKARDRYVLEVTDEEYAAWEANLRAKIGTPYGKGDIVDFIFARAGHQAGHWICSGLAINALQHIRKVAYPMPWEAHQFSPNMVLAVFYQAGARYRKT